MTEIEFYIMDNELGLSKRRYRQAHKFIRRYWAGHDSTNQFFFQYLTAKFIIYAAVAHYFMRLNFTFQFII